MEIRGLGRFTGRTGAWRTLFGMTAFAGIAFAAGCTTPPPPQETVSGAQDHETVFALSPKGYGDTKPIDLDLDGISRIELAQLDQWMRDSDAASVPYGFVAAGTNIADAHSP